ncbi:MAG: ATP-binding cassette domain-containing protein, partial [Trueperaceae bacterium]|nr:ATP-binding cassette domain-containing protein [Trueperaceae bacterium]
FETKWTGKVLWLQPSELFQPGRYLGKRGFSGLLEHLIHYRGLSFILFQLLLGTMLLGLLSLGSPVLSQILFDQVLSLRQDFLLPGILLAIFFLTLFRTVFRTVRQLLSSQLSQRLSYQMRLDYLQHLIALPMRVHETRLTGDLLTRFGDLTQIRSVMSSILIYFPSTLFGLFFSLGLLVIYNKQLALLSFIALPFQVIYLLWLTPKLRANSLSRKRKAGDVESSVLGTLDGLWTLKAFRAENWAIDISRKQIHTWYDQRWKQDLIGAWSSIFSNLIDNFTSLFLLWYGALLVLSSDLTVGQLVAAFSLVRNTMGSINDVISQIEDVQEGLVASDRLLEMTELPKEQIRARYTSLPSLKQGITVKNLEFSYIKDLPILSDINFYLPKGSYTVLLGSNGSGKSTLAGLVSSMLTPDSGLILWDHLALKDVNLAEARKNLVYVKQEVPLFYASLLDNICLGRHIPEKRVLDLLDQLGFQQVLQRLPEGINSTIGGDSPYKLSTGERQMLGIARAFLSTAPVLILDEPTATLDQNREKTVLRFLERLKGERTLLIITHRPALIEPADQIIKLHEGKLTFERAKPLSL